MYSICTIDISIISFNKLFIRVLLMKGAKVQRYNTNGEEKKSDLMMTKTQHSHHREKKKKNELHGYLHEQLGALQEIKKSFKQKERDLFGI